MQISCRLFAWESGSWRERGRGVLRLNECGGGARLVARVAGSLRVVLNTKLWPDMVADRAGTKSLRITAADAHNTVKLFLIMVGSSGLVLVSRRDETGNCGTIVITFDKMMNHIPKTTTTDDIIVSIT